jgi:hypothetical protein
MKVFDGNPELLAGVNSSAFALDEINGAGRYELSPSLCRSDESLRVLILQPDDVDAFACPSAVVPFENRRIGVGAENRTVYVSKRCAA